MKKLHNFISDGKMGYPGAQVARFLGVSASAKVWAVGAQGKGWIINTLHKATRFHINARFNILIHMFNAS